MVQACVDLIGEVDAYLLWGFLVSFALLEKGIVGEGYIYISRFEGAVWQLWSVVPGHCERAKVRKRTNESDRLELGSQELHGQPGTVHVDFDDKSFPSAFGKFEDRDIEWISQRQP